MGFRLAAASATSLVLVSILLVSNLPISPVVSAQPSFDPSTYRSATIGQQPSRLDPARASDFASEEIIQNVYETLIFFGDKPLAPRTSSEITEEYVADITKFMPILAAKVPSKADGDISPDGKNWTFTINTNALFHPWRNSLGGYEPARNLTVDDVVYSFQRQMVYDSPYGDTWMWFEPAFGIQGWGVSAGWSAELVHGPFSTYDNGTFKNPGDEITAGNLIRNWVYTGPDPNQVTFHFQNAWTENIMKQFFASTWNSIVNKDWVIENGGWDGQFTSGWTNNYHWKPTKSWSELDQWKDPSVYGEKGSRYSNATFMPSMCGTGPYKFTSWNQTSRTWQIDKFADYWRGWNGKHVSRVIKQGIAVWSTRRDKFLSGELDDCEVLHAERWYLLSSDGSSPTPVSGVQLYWKMPLFYNGALAFQFKVSAGSPYMPKNGSTPAPNLLADVHMRRAFAYAFNFTEFFEDYFKDYIQPASWWLSGMTPDYENESLIPYSLNSTMVEEELKAAGVFEQGFEVAIVYPIQGENEYNYVMRPCESNVAELFKSLSPKFNVTVFGIDSPTFYNYSDSSYLPIFDFGWGPDFDDPENTARAYMHSGGYFGSWQNYNDTRVDQLVDLGLTQTDGAERNATFQELQYIYWRDVPSLPLYQSTGYRFSRDWVKGWYYNPVYDGFYYYDIYKEAVSDGGDGGGGQAFDYRITLIVAGVVIAVVAVGSATYFRRRKKEPPVPDSKI